MRLKSAGKYLKSYALGVQSAMEYRTDFWLSLVSGVFPLMIQLFIWNAMYAASPGSEVYGYTHEQMIAYTIMAIVVGRLISTGFEYEIAGDIKNGGLNKFIVQPISYFWYRMMCFYGTKSIQLVAFSLILLVLLLSFSWQSSLSLSGDRIVWFALSLLFALLLNGMIFYLLSLLAFWMTEVWAVFIGFNLLTNIMSGGVFPLDIFGPAVNQVLQWLPFPYTIYFPVNIWNGKISEADIGMGLAIQAAWILATALIAGGCWRIGIKKYVAVGG